MICEAETPASTDISSRNIMVRFTAHSKTQKKMPLRKNFWFLKIVITNSGKTLSLEPSIGNLSANLSNRNEETRRKKQPKLTDCKKLFSARKAPISVMIDRTIKSHNFSIIVMPVYFTISLLSLVRTIALAISPAFPGTKELIDKAVSTACIQSLIFMSAPQALRKQLYRRVEVKIWVLVRIITMVIIVRSAKFR